MFSTRVSLVAGAVAATATSLSHAAITQVDYSTVVATAT